MASRSHTPWLFLLAMIVVIGGAYAYSQFGTGSAEVPNATTDYQQAVALSRDSGKPMLLDFTASWCPPCKYMKKHIWPDEQVQQLLTDRVIMVVIDVDERDNRSLMQHYDVDAMPTLVIADADGRILAKQIGWDTTAGPEAMVVFIEDATD